VSAAPALGLAGAVLVAVAFVDMLWTTVGASGGSGPLTGRLSHLLWSLAHRAAGSSQRRHRRLRLAGIAIVIVVFVLWIGLLVGGWSLVFASSVHAVVTTDGGVPANFGQRVYFAGYTTATLGNGEFRPGPGIWQQLTYVATFSGLGMATLAVTYLVPVVGAVTDRRTMALHITSLGRTPQEIVTDAWRRGEWNGLERELSRLGPELFRAGQRHLTYPVLHYFHDVDTRAAAAVAVAVLDEALTLLAHGVAEYTRPDRTAMSVAREGVGSLLAALSSGHIAAAEEAPPVPDLEPLRRAGIPTVSDEAFARACEERRDRRKLLYGFIRDDSWHWRVVHGFPEGAGDQARDAISDDLEDPPSDTDAA
jgi:hypothetical protein